MKKRDKFKLMKKAISYTLVLTSLTVCSGCAKEVDCSVEGEHIHLYINENSKLSRYIDSEKEYVGNLFRTNTYLSMTKDLSIIVDNNLYISNDNIDYLTSKINAAQPQRQSYSYGYVYGSYIGTGFGLNPATGNAEYYYGRHTGWHNGYDWQDIALEEYTSDKVRDITYKFKFYKINKDGTISSKIFDDLNEVPDDYKYFKTKDLIQKNIGESYYLEKQNEKVKNK